MEQDRTETHAFSPRVFLCSETLSDGGGELNVSTAAGAGVDANVAVEALEAELGVFEAAGMGGGIQIEAAAVVADGNAEPAVFDFDGDFHAGRGGVADDVVEHFLEDQ